jgi:hypothetical protein
LLRGRVRLLDLDCALGFQIREEYMMQTLPVLNGRPLPPHSPNKELRELVGALEMFIENYRRMHAGTLYAPDVEAAAADVRAKLNEL